MMKATLPAAWSAAGARFGADGLLYLAEWRRGFTVHELRALFFECQQARALRHEVTRLARELENQGAELAEAQRRASWYRSQLTTEARIGLALSGRAEGNERA